MIERNEAPRFLPQTMPRLADADIVFISWARPAAWTEAVRCAHGCGINRADDDAPAHVVNKSTGRLYGRLGGGHHRTSGPRRSIFPW